MKLRTAAVWAMVGMVASSAAAMNVPVGRSAPSTAATSDTTLSSAATNASVASLGASSTSASPQPRFQADRSLRLDARLGHASLAQGATGETFLFASVSGADDAARSAAPMNLAIVIDRSGSMRGVRLAHAISAATGVVERMRDGDRVTVVAFDDAAQVVVPPTLASASSRSFIQASIRAIRPGGDTCMSCGLESAMRSLEDARVSGDEIDRVILLSDGAANKGVRDPAGLRAIASRMRDRGCAVTTVGLDVDFDEKVMAQIASESNGHHFFVANATDLSQVFDTELDGLLSTIARDAELVIEPARGVDLAEVFDRAFRREGDRVVVPLGTFGPRQEKTALLRLRVPADRAGLAQIASVSLRWRDLTARADQTVSGDLSLAIATPGEATTPIDPFVAARVERSRTARTLTDANRLFEQGKGDEARRTLAHRATELNEVATATRLAAKTAPSPKPAAAPSLDRDFGGQLDALATAQSAFAQPPPSAPAATAAMGGAGRGAGGGGFASAPTGTVAAEAAPAKPQDTREGKKAVRENQSRAFDMAF
jgi:Ca-activated chloride channel family protein